MHVYLSLLDKILTEGKKRDDRTGIGVMSCFGHQMRIDLRKGFPLLTTKRVHFKSIAYELMWFLRGDTNVDYLHEHGVSIWDEWADAQGDLGPVYGKQWRDWDGIDQIDTLIRDIKNIPFSRRHVVCAWNVGQLKSMALPPCHCLFQVYVHDGMLSCQLYQRSADVFLGVPFNIASYALLMHMIAHVTGLRVYEFIHTFGDVHLYLNHIDVAKTQLARQPYPLPTLELNPQVRDMFSWTYDDITLHNYEHHPAIPAPIAV